ncbi:MAG: hybrid sensor histidine kinase/response regulator [Gammaproteobacteria bacterium]|jgi:signal transduction histidine kinase/CheY-like chemotaxis protein
MNHSSVSQRHGQLRTRVEHWIERFDTPVQREQIRILFRQSPFVFFGILASMTAVELYFWGKADRTALLAWLVANLLLTLLRILFVRRFERLQPQGRAILVWGFSFALTSTISGMIWGSSVMLFLQPSDLGGLLLLVVVLTGMTAGSLVPLSSFMPAYFGYAVFTMTPLGLILINLGRADLVFVGYLALVFLMVTLGYSFVVHRGLADFIRLRFQNLDLLRDLERQKAISEKASADKSRFLAATSHDLRQPLHAMSLYLGALSAQLDDREQKGLLSKGLRACDALNDLLTALMDVSRLDSGDVNFDRKAVDMGILLEGIAGEFRAQAERKGIELRVFGEDIDADTDPLMFSRMVRNLLTNACIHSRATRIELGAEERGDEIVVSVRDNGIGIPVPQQEAVFSEFYQLNNVERDRAKGLGLGLAIVKRLADLLDHDLRLESTPGQGCCFYLTLPRLQTHLEPEAQASAGVTTDLGGRFIVLVDDEASVRDAMRVLLRQWGCELLVTEGVESLRRELHSLDYPCPDVVIADYRLRNDTTGLDVVETVYDRFDADIPAVIVSGDTDQVVRRRVEERGCHLLHKPVTPDLLRGTLNRLLAS